jgi:hypothetical protein
MTEIGKLVIGLVVLIINVSCSHQAPVIKTNNRAISEQTTPVTDMKHRWEEECKKLEPIKRSREYPGKQLDVMAELLEQVPAPQVKAELERIAEVGRKPTSPVVSSLLCKRSSLFWVGCF